MNWFYSTRDKLQAGPVDDATLAGLFQSGAITAETLVWAEGMANWEPYAVAFKSPAPPLPVSVPGFVRCAECGREFPPDQVIPLAGRFVCGACKPIAVQKLQEGVVSFGAPVNAEELWQRVEGRGFNFSIGSALSRAWNLVKGNFWPAIGVTLLCYLIVTGVGQIPLANLVAIFLLRPQMMVGLNWYFLKQFRGESATLNDAFGGFRRGYGQQALYMLLIFAVIIGVIIVCGAPLIPVFSSMSKGDDSWQLAVILPVVALGCVAMWYFMLCWIFTPLLILDKGLDVISAMKLSRRVVHLRFWKLLGLFIVLALLTMLSLLAFFIGVFVMLPVGVATLTRVYEDAFGEEGPETAF